MELLLVLTKFMLVVLFFLGAAPAAFQALGRAVSGLAGLLGPAVFSLRSKTWVCGCAAPFSIPHPLIIGPSFWLFLRPSLPFFKGEKGLLPIFFAKTSTFCHCFD